MKKIELILAFLIPIALMLKALDIPGVHSFIIVALSSIPFYYMFIAWRTYKFKFFLSLFDLKKPQNTIGSLSGISIAIVSMGVLFGLMSWPGGKMNLTVGLIFLLVSLIMLLIKRKDIEQDFERLSLSRIFYYGLIGLIFYFVPINKTHLEESNKSNPDNHIKIIDSSKTLE